MPASTPADLIFEIAAARRRFLAAAGAPSPGQATFKPAPDAWSIAEITEHVVHGEQGGIHGVWRALEGLASGRPVWSGEIVHNGRSIEEIGTSTWREREVAPRGTTPRWGGPFPYWAAALRSCQPLLDDLGVALEGAPLEDVVFPHPISGPLDAGQWLEFFRFHLDRHAAQVERVRRHPGFPGA
jgi:hypothetical protein